MLANGDQFSFSVPEVPTHKTITAYTSLKKPNKIKTKFYNKKNNSNSYQLNKSLNSSASSSKSEGARKICYTQNFISTTSNSQSQVNKSTFNFCKNKTTRSLVKIKRRLNHSAVASLNNISHQGLYETRSEYIQHSLHDSSQSVCGYNSVHGNSDHEQAHTQHSTENRKNIALPPTGRKEDADCRSENLGVNGSILYFEQLKGSPGEDNRPMRVVKPRLYKNYSLQTGGQKYCYNGKVSDFGFWLTFVLVSARIGAYFLCVHCHLAVACFPDIVGRCRCGL